MVVPFEIVVGTYEEFLLGYKTSYAKRGNGYTLTQSFATHSHGGSVRTVTSAGRYLASGGADDKICVFDMRSRKEIHVFMHHDGTVNTLAFTPRATHIFSGGADGVMCAMRTGNWQMEKQWGKAHKGSAVNNIAVHPSGKLALSLGGDHVLRTWNLVKGRDAYATNLASRGPNGKLAQSVHWSTSGEHFAISGANVVEIWNVDSAGVIKSYKCAEKAVSIVWVSDDILIVGLEDGKLLIINTDTDVETTIQGHEKRVKCLAFSNDYLVSACSSGNIKLWSLINNTKLEEVCHTKTGCRITCITLVQDDEVKLEKVEEPPKVNEDDSVNNSDSNDDSDYEEKVKVMPIPNRKKEVVVVEIEDNNGPMKNGNGKKSKKRKAQNFETVSRAETSINNSLAGDDNSTSFKVKSKKCKKIKQEIPEEVILHDDDNSTNIIQKKDKKKKNKNNKQVPLEESKAEIINHTPNKNKKSKKNRKSEGNDTVELIGLNNSINETPNKKRKRNRKSMEVINSEHETSSNSVLHASMKNRKSEGNDTVELIGLNNSMNETPNKKKKRNRKSVEVINSEHETSTNSVLHASMKNRKSEGNDTVELIGLNNSMNETPNKKKKRNRKSVEVINSEHETSTNSVLHASMKNRKSEGNDTVELIGLNNSMNETPNKKKKRNRKSVEVINLDHETSSNSVLSTPVVSTNKKKRNSKKQKRTPA